MHDLKTSRRSLLILFGGLLTGCSPLVAAPSQQSRTRSDNSQEFLPEVPLQPPPGRQVATLAGGCFWCLDTLFAELKGVDKVASGYAGGRVANPSYEAVCTGTTGHAEAIQVVFDPKVISYNDLLHIFFTTHDPTTLNRQGPDVGTQYRSAIFYSDEQQKSVAEKVIKEVNAQKLYRRPIVTEVTPYKNFYVAEEYHQNYYGKNPNQGYCRVVIAPKVAKFRKKYMERLKQ